MLIKLYANSASHEYRLCPLSPT